MTTRRECAILAPSNGRLAQLVEHLLDVQVVSGSIPLASIIKTVFCLLRQRTVFFGFSRRTERKKFTRRPTFRGVQMIVLTHIRLLTSIKPINALIATILSAMGYTQ